MSKNNLIMIFLFQMNILFSLTIINNFLWQFWEKLEKNLYF